MTLIDHIARALRMDAMCSNNDMWDSLDEHCRDVWRRAAKTAMRAFVSYRPIYPSTPDDELRAIMGDVRGFGVVFTKDGKHIPVSDVYLPGEHPGAKSPGDAALIARYEALATGHMQPAGTKLNNSPKEPKNV